ncbi:MAG: hypothetical protein QOC94_4473 [Actinoplanes sp.]|jgi:GNAT superfamily N-acetyltransferase|nr:hypothetical protein [Actinoplanes sp.]
MNTRRHVAARHRSNRVNRYPVARPSELPPIVRADPSQARELSSLIASSFSHLPPSQWLIPDAVERPYVLRDYFQIAVEHASHHGVIDVLADGSGVAVWFDHTRPDVPAEPVDYENRRRWACGPLVDRFAYLDDLLTSNYPAITHFHLAFLAVEEKVQGAGRGTALLRHRHRRLDTAYASAYLEAASEQLVTIYQRFGYVGGAPMYLGSSGPAFYPMIRRPYALR